MPGLESHLGLINKFINQIRQANLWCLSQVLFVRLIHFYLSISPYLPILSALPFQEKILLVCLNLLAI